MKRTMKAVVTLATITLVVISFFKIRNYYELKSLVRSIPWEK